MKIRDKIKELINEAHKVAKKTGHPPQSILLTEEDEKKLSSPRAWDKAVWQLIMDAGGFRKFFRVKGGYRYLGYQLKLNQPETKIGF